MDVQLPSILQLVPHVPRGPLDRSPPCCIHGRGVLKHVDEGAAGLGEALQQYTDMSPMAIAAIGQAAQGRGAVVPYGDDDVQGGGQSASICVSYAGIAFGMFGLM